MGMWSYSCDNGHLDDKPKQIKMRVLPTDNVDPAALIEEMVDLGMVTRRQGGPDGPQVARAPAHRRALLHVVRPLCARRDPAKSRERHAAATPGARGHTSGDRREPTLKEGEGRKEGEGEGELVEFERPAGRPRKKPSTKLRDDWQPTNDHAERAIQDGIDLEAQVQRFRAHAEANDRTQVNWNAAFTQWLLNVPEWQKGATSRPRPATPFPANGTEAEKDAWVRAQPLPTDGAYYGGSRR